MNFRQVLFYASKYENQRKSHFLPRFEYLAFFVCSFYLEKGQKCQYLKSPTESHGDIQDFYFLLYDCEVYKFSAAESCTFKRNLNFVPLRRYLLVVVGGVSTRKIKPPKQPPNLTGRYYTLIRNFFAFTANSNFASVRRY